MFWNTPFNRTKNKERSVLKCSLYTPVDWYKNNCHDLHCLSFSDNLIVGVIESDLAPFMTKRHDHNDVTKGAYKFNSFRVWNAHFSPKIYF